MDTEVKIDDANETAAQTLMRCLYEEVTNIRIPWSEMPQQLQQEALDRMQAHIGAVVTGVVFRIATAGFRSVPARIDSLSVKDDAKTVLLLSRGEQLHEVADRVGSAVVIVFADPDEHCDGMQVFRAQADQPQLPME